jgi:hypothetical protein
VAVCIRGSCGAPINYSAAIAFQRMRPKLLQGAKPAWSVAAERELALANAMRQFNARKRDGRRRKRLEGKHRRAAALYCSMILLDDVVEIAPTSDHDRPPNGVFLSQQAQRPVGCRIAIEIYFARAPRLMGLKGFAKECPSSRFAAIRAQQGINGFSVFIHSTVEIVGAAPD